MNGADTGGIILAKPELGTRTFPSDSDLASDWLCAWCFNRVASEKDRFCHQGQSEFSFNNPSGILFDIVTFAQTIDCCDLGDPTLEHTWFPNHAWSYCMCGRCRTHLGWYYTGPTEFVGLVRDRIVRAMLVMN